MQYAKKTDSPKKSFEDRPKYITAGKKILVGVGVAQKIKNGKKVLEVGYVCTKDLENKGEEGCIYFDNFYLTPNALFKLSNWVVALGHTKPFDYESRADIEEIMLSGPFEGVFEDREYNGNKYTNLKWYNEAHCERTESGEPVFSAKEDEIISNAERGFEKILEFRRDNPKFGQYVTSFPAEASEKDEDCPF